MKVLCMEPLGGHEIGLLFAFPPPVVQPLACFYIYLVIPRFPFYASCNFRAQLRERFKTVRFLSLDF